MDVPPELKSMKRFMREAKKTSKVKPVISYYCRLYAVQVAMRLPEDKKSPAVKGWLGDQLGIMEKSNPNVAKEEAQKEIETMADNVFSHADKVDREGNANKQTAAAFNSAFVFYEILKQFGERPPKVRDALLSTRKSRKRHKTRRTTHTDGREI